MFCIRSCDSAAEEGNGARPSETEAYRCHDRRWRQRCSGTERSGLQCGYGRGKRRCQEHCQRGADGFQLCGYAGDREPGPPRCQQHPYCGIHVPDQDYFFRTALPDHYFLGRELSLRAYPDVPDQCLCSGNSHLPSGSGKQLQQD